MGVRLSGLSEPDYGGYSTPSSRGLGDVPESCVSSILMHLDPPEICKLAGLNRTFHGASMADFLWETKLPSNYKFLLNKVLAENHPERLSRKQIYARLCRPNYFDDDTKQVWLDKNSGKIWVMVSYKGLRITGIDDRRYWNHISTDESRFQTVAYLQQIWWLEAAGEIEFEFPPGTYSLFFRLQLGKPGKRFGRRVCNIEQVHGWDIKPVQFRLSASNGQHASSECYLHSQGNWVHYHVGEFVVESSKTMLKIKFSMMQIDCTHTKSGASLDCIFICPTQFKDKLQVI